MSDSDLFRRPWIPRARPGRTTVLVGVLSVAVSVLTACGGSAPESDPGTGDGARGNSSAVTEVDVPGTDAPAAGGAKADVSALPSCEVVERQVGAGLETLEFATEEVHVAEHGRDSSHKTCVWLTEMPEDLRGANADTLMQAVHTGVLTMSINIGPQPLLEADAAAAGYVFHDLRAERAGGYVFAPADTDLADPLGMMGVTVTVDGVDVTWGGGTYFDGQGDQIAEMFNKDWGIEAAVTVHSLIRD